MCYIIRIKHTHAEDRGQEEEESTARRHFTSRKCDLRASPTIKTRITNSSCRFSIPVWGKPGNRREAAQRAAELLVYIYIYTSVDLSLKATFVLRIRKEGK
jgi:hypothetical protein